MIYKEGGKPQLPVLFCMNAKPRLYGLALNERIEKLLNFEIHFHRSGPAGMKT